MVDASLGFVQIEGGGRFAYALRTASGRAWNWALGAWEAAGASPAPAHLRPMAPVTWGSASWSQDTIPAVEPTSSQVFAVFWGVDVAGTSDSWQGTAPLRQGEKGTAVFSLP